MTNLPVALEDLENITEVVARNLLEQWAIDDRFSEENIEKATINAVNDTIFVMNNFMQLFNQKMLLQSQQSIFN